MRLLTEDEKALFYNMRVSRHAHIWEYLRKMSVGDMVFLPNEEWLSRIRPGIIISGYFRKQRGSRKFSVITKPDRSGWFIKRTN